MRVLVLSDTGRFAPLALRLQESGAEVAFYSHTPMGENFDGLLKRKLPEVSDLKAELASMPEGSLLVVDGFPRYHASKRDNDLLRARGIKEVKANADRRVGVFGKFAEWAAREYKLRLIGCTRFAEGAQLGTSSGDTLARSLDLRPWDHGEPLGEDWWYERESLWCTPNGVAHAMRSTSLYRLHAENRGELRADPTVTVTRSVPAPRMPSRKLREWALKQGYVGPISATYLHRGTVWFVGWRASFDYDHAFALDSMQRGSLLRFLLKQGESGLDESLVLSLRLTLPGTPGPTPGILGQQHRSLYAHEVREHPEGLRFGERTGTIGSVCVGDSDYPGVCNAMEGALGVLASERAVQYRSDWREVTASLSKRLEK